MSTFKQFTAEGITIKSAKRISGNQVEYTATFNENPDYTGVYTRKLYAGTGKHAGHVFFRTAGCEVYMSEGPDGFEVVEIHRYDQDFKFQRRRGAKGKSPKRQQPKQQPKQQEQPKEQPKDEKPKEQPKDEQQPKRGRDKLRELREKKQQEQGKQEQEPKHPEWEAEDKEREEKAKEPEDKTWREMFAAFLHKGKAVYLAGPAGCGKSYAVEDICTEEGWEFYATGAVQQEFKLNGFIDALGEYQPTEFYKACTSDKECVFFIDEMDASIPDVLNILNAALANGYHEFPTGRVEFDFNRLHFVAAGNTLGNGADELYTGRAVMDTATLNRFVAVQATYERDVEIKLANGDTDLVDFIHELRDCADRTGIRAVFTYRQIQAAADMVGILNKKQIVQTCIVGTLDKDTLRTMNVFSGGAWAEAFEQVKAAA